MKTKFFFIIFILLVSSCTSKKDILYVQKLDANNSFSIDFDEYKINIDDILKIYVGSKQPELVAQYNPSLIESTNNNSRESLLYTGYQVDKFGNIYFPDIGVIRVLDLTISDLRKYIKETLIEYDLLMDPLIDIKVLNLNFTILGEVRSPGNYTFLKNNLNIFEAIGMAGDLTINGTRNDIRLIRSNSKSAKVYSLDLTSPEIFQSELFQVKSGDVIIVNQNSSRVKNAGIIGNSGTLLSLLSFILSTIIITTN